MSNLWSTRKMTEPEKQTIDAEDTIQVANTSKGQEEEVEQMSNSNPLPLPPRPLLQRNAMQQPGPGQDMSQPTQEQRMNPNLQQPGAATDSLSLAQLKQIVSQVNRVEPLAYDFVYADLGPHAEEIDEWFVYQFWQWVRLNAAQKAFEWHWSHESGTDSSWDDADNDTRTKFVQAAISGVQSNDAALRSASIGKLAYLVLGRWGDTAMANATDGQSRSIASLSQLQAIKAGVECLTSLEGLPVIWDALRTAFESQWYIKKENTGHVSFQG